MEYAAAVFLGFVGGWFTCRWYASRWILRELADVQDIIEAMREDRARSTKTLAYMLGSLPK